MIYFCSAPVRNSYWVARFLSNGVGRSASEPLTFLLHYQTIFDKSYGADDPPSFSPGGQEGHDTVDRLEQFSGPWADVCCYLRSYSSVSRYMIPLYPLPSWGHRRVYMYSYIHNHGEWHGIWGNLWRKRGRKAGLKNSRRKETHKKDHDAATNRVTPVPRHVVFMSTYARAKHAAADPVRSSGNAGNLQTNTDPSSIHPYPYSSSALSCQGITPPSPPRPARISLPLQRGSGSP